MKYIFIEGHSGYMIDVKNYKNKIVLEKSGDKKTFERLEKQINKQIEYSKILKTPKIIKKINYGYFMEYKNKSITIIEYLENAKIKDIILLFEEIKNTINTFIKLSNNKFVDEEIKTKTKDVIERCKKNIDKEFSKKILNFINSFENISIPVGYCHGDLTLSNILIEKNKIHYIDFLDTFCETPLQDIVKIRQDTKYGWVVLQYMQNCDKNKIYIILDKLDEMFVEYFKTLECYKYYKLFQVLNLLRILQYSKNKQKTRHLKKCIRDIIE